MQIRQVSQRPLPGLVPLIIFCGVLAVSWMVTPDRTERTVTAPSAPAAIDTAALSNLVAKLKAQQDTLADNQTKIEAQTALLKGKLQEAKNFAHRLR